MAHVLNLSAKAMLLGVKIARELEENEEQQVLPTDAQEFVLDAAENPVARTVVKVCVSFSVFSV